VPRLTRRCGSVISRRSTFEKAWAKATMEPTATVCKPGLGLGVARAGRSWPNANAPAGPSVAAEHSPRRQT
jgi:hypothetical protein